MIPDEHREFVESHRLCVVGLPRGGDAPALSPVYYVVDGNDLLISTTASRFKGRALRRGSTMSVCILHEEFPFPYLTVFGRGQIEEEGAPELMARIGEVMMGSPVPDDARPAIEERARNEGRVVLRFIPERFVTG